METIEFIKLEDVESSNLYYCDEGPLENLEVASTIDLVTVENIEESDSQLRPIWANEENEESKDIVDENKYFMQQILALEEGLETSAVSLNNTEVFSKNHSLSDDVKKEEDQKDWFISSEEVDSETQNCMIDHIYCMPDLVNVSELKTEILERDLCQDVANFDDGIKEYVEDIKEDVENHETIINDSVYYPDFCESAVLETDKFQFDDCEEFIDFDDGAEDYVEIITVISDDRESVITESAPKKSNKSCKRAVKVKCSTTSGGPKKFKCDQCEYITSYKHSLKVHVNLKHLKLKNHKCPHCEFRAGQKTDLKYHIEAKHLKIKDQKCRLCPYSTTLKRYLKRHLALEHLDMNIHKCKICDFSVNRESLLIDHVNCTHLNVKKLECDVCGYSTPRKHNLKYHIESVHLKRPTLRCESCDYRTTSKHDLKCHLDYVHVNRDKYPCDSCDYRTSDKRSLKRHVDGVHLKLKPFKCNICGHRTNRKENLKKHVKNNHF